MEKIIELNAIIGSSETAWVHFNKQVVLRDPNAVLHGARCTWFFITYQGTFLVITAKHCTLPFEASSNSITFVPKAVALSGINRFGFIEKNSPFVQHDIVMFNVTRLPPELQVYPTEYQQSNADLNALDSLIYGQGASDIVQGRQLGLSVGNSVHYVTIVNHHVRGNAGTAMFQAQNGQ